MVFGLLLACALLASVGAVSLAGLMLLVEPGRLRRLTELLIPYAIGTLLGAAFLGMVPHALAAAPARMVLPAVMGGILLFFALERASCWRHCHDPECKVHTRMGEVILVGDALHNFVDGVAMAVAFMHSIPLGLATSLAVIAHELPQEAGDFAILLQAGYSRKKAFAWNALSSAATLPGAWLAFQFLPRIRMAVPYLLALSAASFIYIALADLVPGRRLVRGGKAFVLEFLLILLGIATIAFFHRS